MKKSKLYYYLHQLKAPEMRTFKAFLASPALNKDMTLLPFLEGFEREVLKKTKDIDRETFHARVYPGQPYNANYQRVTMARLLDSFMQFLSFSEWRQDQDLQEAQVFRVLNRRHWDKFIPQRYARRKKALERAAYQGSDWYRQMLDLESEMYSFRLRKPRKAGPLGIEDSLRALDNYYFVSKLGLACLHANQRRIIPTEFEIPGMPELLDMAQARPNETAVMARILVRIYGMLTEAPAAADAHFEALKGLLETDMPGFPAPVQLNMYTYAVNHCGRRAAEGHSRFLEEAGALYRRMVDRKLFSQDGKLPPSYLKSIVSLHGRIGARTGDFEWVKSLLAKQARVRRGTPDSRFVRFNQGVLLFYREKYVEAARIFQAIWREFADEFYRLDARAYMLMAYFELEVRLDWEKIRQREGFSDFETEWSAFRMYLSRNKQVALPHRRAYKAFHQLLRRLLRAQGQPRPKMQRLLQELQSEVAANTQVAHRNWLEKRIVQSVMDEG